VRADTTRFHGRKELLSPMKGHGCSLALIRFAGNEETHEGQSL